MCECLYCVWVQAVYARNVWDILSPPFEWDQMNVSLHGSFS